MSQRQPFSFECQQALERRHAAAELLDAVLDELISPQIALNRWPVDHPIESGLADRSLLTAYQVLWHFEADETQQQSEPFYLDTQIQLLSQIQRLLRQGKDLPSYILENYTPEHQPQFYQAQTWQEHVHASLLGPFTQVRAWYRFCRKTLQQALGNSFF